MSAMIIGLFSGLTVAVFTLAFRPPEDWWTRLRARFVGRPRVFEAVKTKEARRLSRRRARFEARVRPGRGRGATP